MNQNSPGADHGEPQTSTELDAAILAAFKSVGLQCETVRIPLEAGGGVLLSSEEISQYGGHLARGLNARGFTSATFETKPMRGVFIAKEEATNPPALREALAGELAVLHPVMDEVAFLQRL